MKKEQSMPNYFTYAGFKLYFQSNELNEPVHVHVSKGKPGPVSTKFWVLSDGTIELANNKAELNKKDLKLLTRFIEANYDEVCLSWKNFFQLSEIKFYK